MKIITFQELAFQLEWRKVRQWITKLYIINA